MLPAILFALFQCCYAANAAENLQYTACPVRVFSLCRNNFFRKIGLPYVPTDGTTLLERVDTILSNSNAGGFKDMCIHYEELRGCLGPLESACLEFKTLIDSGLTASVAQVFRPTILALNMECQQYMTSVSKEQDPTAVTQSATTTSAKPTTTAEKLATTVSATETATGFSTTSRMSGTSAKPTNLSLVTDVSTPPEEAGFTDNSTVNPEAIDTGCDLDGNFDIFSGLFCTNSFISCANGSRSLETCPNHLRFDNNTQSCLDPKLVPSCSDEHMVITVEISNYLLEGNCSDWGVSVKPDPEKLCSQYYYLCSNGIPHKVTCPSGQLFDHSKAGCLPYDQVDICIGTKLVADSSRSLPLAEVPDSLPAVDCESKADGNYPNPLVNCSHLFYSCSGGTWEVQKCPGETKFDATINSCQFGQFVADCGGIEMTSTSTLPTTPHTTTESPVSCLDKEEGNYADPIEHCSRVFYTCVGGDTLERVCPAGTRYDVDADKCEFRRFVPACNGTIEVTTVSTTAKTLSPTTHAYHFDCTMKKDGNYRDSRVHCSSDFFSCVSGVGLIQHCPGHLRYDAVTDSCQFARHVIDCGGKPPMAQSSTVVVTTTKPLFAFICVDRNLGNYPNPSVECSQVFFTCSGGHWATIRQCAGDTYYDEELDMCLYFPQVPKCVGTPRVTIGTTSMPASSDKSTRPTPKMDILIVDTDKRRPIVVIKENPQPNSMVTTTVVANVTIATVNDSLFTSTNVTDAYSHQLNVTSMVSADNSTTWKNQSDLPSSPDLNSTHPSLSSADSRQSNVFDCSGSSANVYPPPGAMCVSHYYQCHDGAIHRVICPGDRKYSRSLEACLAAVHVPECRHY